MRLGLAAAAEREREPSDGKRGSFTSVSSSSLCEWKSRTRSSLLFCCACEKQLKGTTSTTTTTTLCQDIQLQDAGWDLLVQQQQQQQPTTFLFLSVRVSPCLLLLGHKENKKKRPTCAPQPLLSRRITTLFLMVICCERNLKEDEAVTVTKGIESRKWVTTPNDDDDAKGEHY